MNKPHNNILFASALVFISVFSSNSFSQNISEKISTIRLLTYPGQIYSNADILVCGEKKVVIASTCVAYDSDNSDPYCFSQNVLFVQFQERQAISFFYNYEQDQQNFIYRAACLKHKDQFFVELMNSNLGNCKSCEWYDYFSVNGSYIGSSDGPKGKTSFRKIKLTKQSSGMLGGASRLEEIVLTTVAH